MPAKRPWWDWGRKYRFDYDRPSWEPFPQREPASRPRSPGRKDDSFPPVIARSEGDDTTAIERELERRRRQFTRNSPPPPPPRVIQPPWSDDEGTDKCAWYLSFRYGHRFGIYICVECIDRIAEMLWRHGMEYERAQRVAFVFLYGHEQFHYRVDRGVELLEHSLEVATGNATELWLQRWVTSRFHTPGRGLDLLEEACANQQGLASALKDIESDLTKKPKRKSRDKEDVKRDKDIADPVLSAMMKASGLGYSFFKDVSGSYINPAQDDLMSWFLLLDKSGMGKPVGPVTGLSRVIPRPVKKGGLGIDPEVPLFLVNC